MAHKDTVLALLSNPILFLTEEDLVEMHNKVASATDEELADLEQLLGEEIAKREFELEKKITPELSEVYYGDGELADTEAPQEE